MSRKRILFVHSRQASVIGKKVCQEANQPNTRSARSTPPITFTGFGQRPGW